MITFPPFPATPLLTYTPPNYEQEWIDMIRNIILTSVILLMVFPSILRKALVMEHRIQTKSKKIPNEDNDTKEEVAAATVEKEKKIRVPFHMRIRIYLLYISLILYFICALPNNTKTARHVYIAPLLHKEECQQIINIGYTAAGRLANDAKQKLKQGKEEEGGGGQSLNEKDIKSFEKILEWPTGWRKDRKESYPTTDLNVVIDFNQTEKNVFANKLHSRLSPLIERLYGVPRESMRVNDMFMVRYDGNGTNQRILSHMDASHISFNILLNDNFEGGGTSYLNRVTGEQMVAYPNTGEVVINNAMMEHEGLPTTKGTRYIIVGFINIDRLDPFTGKARDIDVFSTYFSLPWLFWKFREALVTLKENEKNTWKEWVLIKVITCLGELGDLLASHAILKVVEAEHHDKYLEMMDKFYRMYEERLKKATWFSGQWIHVGFNGLLSNEWEERLLNKAVFQEDL